MNIEIDKKRVFKAIQLQEDSPAYKETNKLYDLLEKQIKHVVSPEIIYHLDHKLDVKVGKSYEDSQRSLYVVVTLGGKITESIATYFNENQYLKAYVMNALADGMLFSMVEISRQYVYEFAKENHMNLTEKLSPGDNIPLELQKPILEKIDPKGDLDIRITEGYMLDPEKSGAWMYGVYMGQSLDENKEHDCRGCHKKNCLWREENDEVNC
ncbi:hypothetical protein [Natronincola ferrireducens]|uniref:Vitamin B12 dependent methionine synthase, activation domain n=1 Tax=Natronincola ferrireducens TaxID=393762 RepID=A0A1G9FTW0_9FIRM|nr:hypothetical protein [Natronincola ferrireducens]SDK91866.1 hypothetical protein SAMN05660472_02248 [Natronincola ferrireducens]